MWSQKATGPPPLRRSQGLGGGDESLLRGPTPQKSGTQIPTETARRRHPKKNPPKI